MYRRTPEGWALVPPLPAQDAAALAAAESMEPGGANAAELRTRLRAARAANSVFLAVPSPTAAQVVEQVRALTRQMQGVIRLAASDLDGVE